MIFAIGLYRPLVFKGVSFMQACLKESLSVYLVTMLPTIVETMSFFVLSCFNLYIAFGRDQYFAYVHDLLIVIYGIS